MSSMANILQIAKSTRSSGVSFLYWLSSFDSSFSTADNFLSYNVKI